MLFSGRSHPTAQCRPLFKSRGNGDLKLSKMRQVMGRIKVLGLGRVVKVDAMIRECTFSLSAKKERKEE